MALVNYRYIPLKEGEIRLVSIDRASSSHEEIRITMTVRNMAECPDYRLLTYTWGDPSDSGKVICDGYEMHVTRNLYLALLALREKDSVPTPFFIDAMCINQSDESEKAKIMGNMTHILAQAIHTILWLGTESNDTSVAFELISKLVSARRDCFQDLPLSQADPHAIQPAVMRYRQTVSVPSRHEWKALDDLMAQRIFTRSWTVEDIVFSQDILLRCGPFEAPWADLCYGLEAYVSHGLPNQLRNLGGQTIVNLNTLREHRLTGRSLTADYILEMMRDLTATVRHDKVYAAITTIYATVPRNHSRTTELQQVTQDSNRIPPLNRAISLPNRPRSQSRPTSDNDVGPAWLPFNYAYSPREAFIQTAKALNRNDSSVGTSFCSLSMVEDSRFQQPSLNDFAKSEPHDFPSWVPDWMVINQVYRLNTAQSTFRSSKGGPQESIQFTGYGTMVFQGYIVDVVDQIGNYLPPRRWYDKYNTGGANSFFFLEWMEQAKANAGARYRGQSDRLLLDWVETVQAKDCGLWNESWTFDSDSLIKVAKAWLTRFEDEDQVETEDIRHFHAACLPSYGRRFGVTRRGHFCLIPRSTVRHDLVCIPYGSKIPFIFRKIEDQYLNIGECYVHGAMKGEALSWKDLQEVEFVLR